MYKILFNKFKCYFKNFFCNFQVMQKIRSLKLHLLISYLLLSLSCVKTIDVFKLQVIGIIASNLFRFIHIFVLCIAL